MRTIVRALLLVAGLFSFETAVFSQQVAKQIPNATSPDGRIGFLQFTPPDYGSQKHPLIIFLHGIGERGNGTTQLSTVAYNGVPLYCSQGAPMRFTVNGQTSSFVVLSPQLSASYGYWPTFYVKEMIKYAKANLQIDPNRIYLTGLSLGGGGVWRSITDTENFDNTFDAGIAAAAPVCGTQEENDYNFCNTIGTNHLPVWAFHSMDDGMVWVGSTQHAEALALSCGLSPAAKFTYYQTGNHSGAWVNAYDTGHITRTVSVGGALSSFTASPNLYEWFLMQSRSSGQPVYTAPVASAGAAQTITLPISTITLTGSGTGTNGASIASYSWTKTSGPSGGVISLPLLNTTLVTGLVQGTYVFTLTVTDNHGLSSSADVTITVNPLLNQAPVANAGSGQTIVLPTNSVTLDGSASYDPDGTIASYYWSQASGPSSNNLAGNAASKITATGLLEGTYVFTLQVKDDAGATSSSNVTVTVSPAVAPPPAAPPATTSNQAPVSNAGGDITITLPTNSVTLDGSASYDPDGSIAQYYWIQNSGPAGTNIANVGNVWAAKTELTNLVQGVYMFTLQVKDNNGTPSWAAKKITVNAAPANQPPVANAGGDITITLPTNSVTLDGTASYDPDGSVIQYYWVLNGGPGTATFENAWAAKTTLNNLVQGVYVVTLQVKDNNGVPFWSAKKITVNAAPVTTPTPPATPNNLLGYIKMSYGPNYACADASSNDRIPIYGSSIANGSVVYADAALTQKYNGGWNWFSFTPVLGGPVTQAFAIYPLGNIGLLTICSANMRTADSETSAADNRNADPASLAAGKLSMYPNPVRTAATIVYTSETNTVKTLNVFSANGVLKAKYTWQLSKGNNTFSLKNIAGLANGLYVIDVRDANGNPEGKLKFIKL